MQKVGDLYSDVVTPRELSSRALGFVFLRGFPGTFTQHSDLAYFLSGTFGCRSFLPCYKGLDSSPGEFSFIQTFEDISNFLDLIREKYKIESFVLVGHSFGGAVSIHQLANRDDVHQAFLIAPLLVVPDPKTLTAMLEPVFGLFNKFGEQTDVEKVALEIPDLIASYLPFNFIDKLEGISNKFAIIHGSDDKVIPVRSTHAFIERFQSRPQFFEVSDNHSLGDHRMFLFQKSVELFS